MANISFNIACKELKIEKIFQLNQLFQLLHLVRIHGHGFYELSRMLMRKNVNNGVSKDSHMAPSFLPCVFYLAISATDKYKIVALGLYWRTTNDILSINIESKTNNTDLIYYF